MAAAEIHIKEHYSYFDVTKAYTTLLALSPVSCPSEILYNFGNVPEMIFAHYLQMAFSKWSWTQWNTDRKRQQDKDLKVSKQQSYRAGPGLQGRSWTIPSSYWTRWHNFQSKEGDIGGYPISQYRKNNWQIPKYRVENRRNTDTAIMIVHAYLKL